MAEIEQGVLARKAETPSTDPASLRSIVAQLAPSCMGLASARVAYLTLSFGSYRRTDDGLMTDGALLIAILMLCIPLIVLQRPAVHVKKRQLWSITRTSMITQAVLLLVYALLLEFDVPSTSLAYAVSIAAALAFAGSTFHWIRRACGANADVAAVFVLLALAISEALLYVLALLPEALSCVVASVLALAQFPCISAARRRPLLADLRLGNLRDGFFGDAARMAITSRKFLATSAAGLILMGFAVGILRGYPFGDAIQFDGATRFGYAALTIALCLYLCMRTTGGASGSPMTVAAWVVMQLLGALALLMYAVLPNHLAVGAMFTNTLNALLIAYMWYGTIAFLSCGPNDAYYYCIGGWTAFLLPRAITRATSITIVTTQTGISITVAMVGLLLLVCAQVVFLQLYSLRSTPADQTAPNSLGAPLDHILGLSTTLTPSEVRDASIQRQIGEIRDRYQLSDREAEVLALYAQGETQNKIAETLGITINTAHAHIKHIYSKCDLHSRQEVLDFMRDYGRM